MNEILLNLDISLKSSKQRFFKYPKWKVLNEKAEEKVDHWNLEICEIFARSDERFEIESNRVEMSETWPKRVKSGWSQV